MCKWHGSGVQIWMCIYSSSWEFAYGQEMQMVFVKSVVWINRVWGMGGKRCTVKNEFNAWGHQSSIVQLKQPSRSPHGYCGCCKVFLVLCQDPAEELRGPSIQHLLPQLSHVRVTLLPPSMSSDSVPDEKTSSPSHGWDTRWFFSSSFFLHSRKVQTKQRICLKGNQWNE